MLKNILLFWIQFNNRTRYAGLLLFLCLGLIALPFFLFFSSLFVRAISLIVALRFISFGVLEAVDLLVFPISTGNRKRLATSISAGSMFFFLILQTQSVILAALAWVMFLVNVGFGLLAIGRIATQGMMLARLRICHRRHEFQSLGLPLVYLVSAPGLTAYYENKLGQEISLRLNKLNIPLSTLTFSAIQTQPIDFQRWIVTQAAALVVIRRPSQTNNPEFEQRLFEYQALCVGSMFTLYMEPEKLKAKFFSEHDEVEELAASFSGDATAFEELMSGAKRREPTDKLNKISDGLSGSAVKFVDHFTSTVHPTSESNSRLSADLRTVSHLLANDGLPPVANCYLRFRLAQSDVERYLCLLDCVETLIKISAIVLLASQWEDDPQPELSSKLTRPSLGQWIELLRNLVKLPDHREFEQHIADFWQRPLHDIPLKLIDESRSSGLDWRGQLPRSHLVWLDWFVWLRNITRGHGSIEERKATTLWHSLHETFLYMVNELKELVLLANLEMRSLDETSVFTYKGWQRKGHQFAARTEAGFNGVPTLLVLTPSLDQAPILIFPLCIQKSGQILVWNSARSNEMEYIDYGSGKLFTENFGETNPRSLWERTVS
jgi:hypothetical protein